MDWSFLLVSRKMISLEIKNFLLPHHIDGMPWSILRTPGKYIFCFKHQACFFAPLDQGIIGGTKNSEMLTEGRWPNHISCGVLLSRAFEGLLFLK